MTANTPSPLRAAQLGASPRTDAAGNAPTRRKEPTMNAATIARIAAWNVIADQKLPAGTKVTVEDGWVTIRPHGSQPARVPYGPADTPDSLYSSLKEAAQATTKGNN